jgi:hypothetical protein
MWLVLNLVFQVHCCIITQNWRRFAQNLVLSINSNICALLYCEHEFWKKRKKGFYHNATSWIMSFHSSRTKLPTWLDQWCRQLVCMGLGM